MDKGIHVFKNGVLPDRCESKKELGNIEYRKGNLENALKYYNKAIRIAFQDLRENSPKNVNVYVEMAMLFSNRAATHFKLDDHYRSIMDCLTGLHCLKSNQTNDKKFVPPKDKMGLYVKLRVRLVQNFLKTEGPAGSTAVYHFVKARRMYDRMTKPGEKLVKTLNLLRSEVFEKLTPNKTQLPAKESFDTKFQFRFSGVEKVKITGDFKIFSEPKQPFLSVKHEKWFYILTCKSGSLEISSINLETNVLKKLAPKNKCPASNPMNSDVLSGSVFTAIGKNCYVFERSLLRFNLKKFKWFPVEIDQKKYFYCPFSGHVVTSQTSSSVVYFFGGIHVHVPEQGLCGNMVSYDIQKNVFTKLFVYDAKRTANSPIPRMTPCLWIDENTQNVFVFGGRSDRENARDCNLGDLWCFDIKNKKWKEILIFGSIPRDGLSGFYCKSLELNRMRYILVLPHHTTSEDVSQSVGEQNVTEEIVFGRQIYQIIENPVLEGNEVIGHTRELRDVIYVREAIANFRMTLKTPSNTKMSWFSNSFVFNKSIMIFCNENPREFVKLTFDTAYQKLCSCCLKNIPKMKKCSKCRIRYCSRECQNDHWKWHKEFCNSKKTNKAKKKK